ncbi:MAG TPA: YoaK family protein [Rhodopila sp.]
MSDGFAATEGDHSAGRDDSRASAAGSAAGDDGQPGGNRGAMSDGFAATEGDRSAGRDDSRASAAGSAGGSCGASSNPGAPTRHAGATKNDGAFGLALLLAGLAGWVDAAGLAGSGGLFLSFMSGNTTDLAASLVHQEWPKAALIGAVIALFVAGVAAGELLEPLGGRFGPSLVLGVEAAALACGAALHWPGLVVPPSMVPYVPCPLVFAMGLQNATMHRAGGIGIGLTYVTGTLVQIGRALADIVGRKGGGDRVVAYGAVWLSLAFGSGCGVLALSLSPLAALSAAAGVALLLAVGLAVRGGAQGGHPVARHDAGTS